ncbi:PucR family transcriptional regulator [Labedella endophytica]|uniref:PucR family transcriptional regulator n=1 Tax=Labedella endophytica TaxID=1523160 RepID=A0A3S0VVW9_9MICO|nr:PucR family transcriptional regulator [Labedella endophytica]RUR03371.1 PucR family transcriptional regulator [Labedella endophytica]
MHPTVRALIAEPSLRLTLLEPGADGALEEAVSWAHGSDLPDPTPFLDPGQILLTTGTQFLTGEIDAAVYVNRLTEAGIAALGFGTEVATTGTPAPLVAACAATGLPLFEVPYEVPFIAVARAIADRVAAAEHARDTWALGAMRAIAFSALRADGVAATLDELARQLDRAVVLVDASATVAHGALGDGPLGTAVLDEAQRLLARGQRSSSSLHDRGESAVLQTIGRRSELRGVLAVIGGRELDASDQTVVTSVVALVGLALEQGRGVSRAQEGVRTAAVRLLLEGRADLAGSVLGGLAEDLPAGDLAIARLSVAPATGNGALSPDEGFPTHDDLPRGVLAAGLDGTVVVIAAPPLLDDAVESIRSRVADRGTVRAGVSAPSARTDLARADDEARAALAVSSTETPVVRAADLATRGVDWLLDRPESRTIASAVLRPIAHDPALLESLEAWLAANGQTDPAARRLRVHRHTLRSRVTTIERLIERDLSTVTARTEAWIALRALRSLPRE